MANNISFRFAVSADVPEILSLIRRLAEYEHLAQEVVASEELLEEWLFERKVAEVLFVLEDNVIAGMGLFFYNFSTFLGKGGIYLEDLFIQPQYRGKGLGKALLKQICTIAVERGCGRVDWQCLRWNEPSLAFYRSLGAVSLDEWLPLRLSGETLALAAKKEAAQTWDRKTKE